jgi:hypothetical protein
MISYQETADLIVKELPVCKLCEIPRLQAIAPKTPVVFVLMAHRHAAKCAIPSLLFSSFQIRHNHLHGIVSVLNILFSPLATHDKLVIKWNKKAEFFFG